MGSSTGKLSVLGELWAFMRTRKKWWLGPIIVTLLLLGLLLVFTQGRRSHHSSIPFSKKGSPP